MNLRLPKMSESEAAGKLIRIPGIVEAAAIIPVQSVGAPKCRENGFRTGLLDIVELRIAKNPIVQSAQKALTEVFLVPHATADTNLDNDSYRKQRLYFRLSLAYAGEKS